MEYFKKNQYSYNSGNLDGFTLIDTINYSYENSAFPDECTSYDGQEITYDELGNPLSYLGWDMTWNAGRRLSTMKNGSMDISFTYNDEGIRTSKTVDGVATSYTSIDGRITSQNDGTNQMYFRYDKNNSLTGFNLSGTEYLYVKNAQGDITGVLDKDGNQVVSYIYDAWGKVESISGSSADTVGKLNPMRYRGYYEDTETGLYYLHSRYYNADTCRFINADLPEMTVLSVFTKTAGSPNVFSYCRNNPIMNIDTSGYFYLSLKDIASFAAILGLYPVVVKWIAIGVTRLSAIFAAEIATLGAKIGAIFGPAGSFAFTVILGIIGYAIAKNFAAAVIEAAVQGKRGIEFKFKYTWWGWPYGIRISPM